MKAKFEGDFKRFVSDLHAKGMKLGVWLIRGIPNTGIQFLVYETLKDVLDAYG